MSLILIIKSGPLQGRKHPIYPGFVIGRVDSEILINDPKISGRHAKFETSAAGDLVLVDLGSRNKIVASGNKVDSLIINPGVKFRLGRTDFEVLKATEKKMSLDDTTLPPLPMAPKTLDWAEYFALFCKKSLSKVVSRPKKLHPFRPLLIFKFVAGLHIGEEWILGYGPRKIGHHSSDLPIYDESTQPLMFEVEQIGADFIISASPNCPVRLNDKVISSEKLSAGDVISFAKTKIKVSFQE